MKILFHLIKFFNLIEKIIFDSFCNETERLVRIPFGMIELLDLLRKKMFYNSLLLLLGSTEYLDGTV